MLDHGADVNARNNVSITLFHFYVNAHILIYYVTMQTEKTPLHYAIKRSVTLMKILIAYGADINAPDNVRVGIFACKC